MNISSNGLVEIESSEGWSSGPYYDKIGRVWTAYFGETKGIGPNSPRLTRSQGETRLKARFDNDFSWALHPFEHLAGFTQNMYDALASFIWNCGVGAVAGSTRVGRFLRARQWKNAATAMLEWCKAGGVVIRGLLDRREREVKLFLLPGKIQPVAYLTPGERKAIEELEGERKIAKRHGGWDHVDASHLQRAVKLKAQLRQRVHALEKYDLSKLHRRDRVEAINAVLAG